MKKMGIVKKIIIILISIIVFFGVLITVSPNLRIFMIRSAFFKIPKDTRENEYETELFKVQKDLEYVSEYGSNLFDVYVPKNELPGKPTIFWIHGGGFIGGDKVEVAGYAEKLAEEGYTIFSMNYELAPKASYPNPVIQLGEFIDHLEKNAEELGVSFDNVFIAGDSAGAQIASQYLSIQANEQYAKEVGIEKTIEINKIKGALLYCGIYSTSEVASKTGIIGFVFKNIGLGYFNDKNWYNDETINKTSIFNYITKDFPSVYVTDGNTVSFESQNRTLVDILSKEGVPVTSRFFDLSEGEVGHEYQFKLEQEYWKSAFEDSVKFLKENTIGSLDKIKN